MFRPRYLLLRACTRWHGQASQARLLSELEPKRTDTTPAIPQQPGDPVPQKLLKRAAVEHHAVSPATFNDDSIWIPIYRVPFLNICRLVVKVKLGVTLTSLAVCINKLYIMLHNSSISPITTALFFCISSAGLIYVGDYARKIICRVYISEDGQYVRIARLSFFGNRRDMVLPRSIITPLSETNIRAETLMLTVKLRRPDTIDFDYDNWEFYESKFYMTVAFGGILDRAKFNHVFGRLLMRNLKS